MNRPSRYALAFVLFALATPVAAKDHRPPVTTGMTYLEQHNLSVKGTAPDSNVTRGDFVNMVVNLVYPNDVSTRCFEELGSMPQSDYTHLFRDVKVTDANAQVLCVGLKTGIIHGEADGSFRGAAAINSAEVAYMLYKAYDLGPLGRLNVPRAPWYTHFIWDLHEAHLLTTATGNPGHTFTWEEAGEILAALQQKQMDLQRPVAATQPVIRLMGLPENQTSQTQTRDLVMARGMMMVVPRISRR